jgi:hypothetical protein
MCSHDGANALLRGQAVSVEFGGTLFGRWRQLDAFDGADFLESMSPEDQASRCATPPSGL